MKLSPLRLFLLMVVFFACNPKQEEKASNIKTQGDSLVPFQVTVLAELPDSLQPQIFLLEKMPKPASMVVPKTGSITKMLPVLQNEKGQTILDADGKPYIMGDGGRSNFTNFTTDNGLALDAVNCSFLDKFGNFWFGTAGGGVSRYDGKSFRTFTSAQGLAGNDVRSIIEDKAGNLWFATYGGGVSRYDGKSFRTFTTAQGLANNRVSSIAEDKAGNLWIGTFGGGVSRYDGKSFRTFTTAEGLVNMLVRSMAKDKTGNLWFGTISGGVSRYDGKSFRTFTAANGLANNIVTAITEDKNGNIWFGTYGGGVSRYDGESFRTFTTAQGLANNDIRSITEDNIGNLWIGTGGGVSRYDGQSFSTFTTAQGLSNNVVMSITVDKTGNLWFGTFSGGVSRYEGKSFTAFTTAEGLANNEVTGITEDKTGNLWFGTNGAGVSRYDGHSFQTFTTDQGHANNVVISIGEDKTGNLWFGSFFKGVSRFDGKSLRTFTTAQGLASNSVSSIAEDKMGNLWFSVFGGGVSRYDGKSFQTFSTAQGLANNDVHRIIEDKWGNLWIATYNGLSRYDGKSFSTFTTAQGLANNHVKEITEDKTGNLWFGTTEGLSVMRAEDVRSLTQNPILSGVEGVSNGKKTSLISSTLFTSFTMADGLPDNVVTQVIQMPNGKMAVGTNLGITLFNPTKDFTKLTDIEIFNSNTGYPVKNVVSYQNAMFLDSKGIIWASTGSEKTALVRFDYAALISNKEVPKLVIQAIKVKDENISWYDLSKEPLEKDSMTTAAYITEEAGIFGRSLTLAERYNMRKRFGNIRFDGIQKFYPLPENLVLPYKHNQLSFEFAAIETSRPSLVKYQYMLEGYDQDWNPVTSRANASFGNIHEGTYTFKLKAQGANGVWSEPISYSFEVLPPWWRSWWAYTIYALLFLGALRIFSKWRERNLRYEKEQLQVKVDERTRELQKSLQDLKSTQSQLIQSEKMASLGELTAGIAHEIQNPLNFVNNFSEVSKELIAEMKDEIDKIGNKDLKAMATDIENNLGKINHHGKRADLIVKGMLQHSRTSTGQKEPTNINTLADEYLRLSFQGMKAKDRNFNATLETDFDETLSADKAGIGQVNIIPQDIGRVLLNLYNNAFYAVAEKQKTSNEGYQPTVSVTTKKVNGEVEITVADNGNGIPEKVLDKVFQPFFTTKPTGQGTGLGLSLSYDIIKAHRGKIEIRNKPGEGAEFIITLPINA